MFLTGKARASESHCPLFKLHLEKSYGIFMLNVIAYISKELEAWLSLSIPLGRSIMHSPQQGK